MRSVKIIAVSGCKDSGKTTLCRELIRALSRRGLSVGYIKRTQESVISPAVSDTGSVAAGGLPAVLWGNDGLKIELASTDNHQSDPYEIAGRFFPAADIVILEGGKNLVIPKIWVFSPGEDMPDAPGVFAVYDRYREGDNDRRYGANDLDRLVSVIADKAKLSIRNVRVYIGCKELPMKGFVADFVTGGLTGMLSALKKPDGFDEGGDVRVYMRGNIVENE